MKKDYFEKFEPRYDLFTNKKLEFKDRKTYFNIDGLHESKSPSTQLEVIGDLVTIREAIVSKQLKIPVFLETIIPTFVVFLYSESN